MPCGCYLVRAGVFEIHISRRREGSSRFQDITTDAKNRMHFGILQKKSDVQKETPQFEVSENINIKISDVDKIMSDLSDLIILKNSLGHILKIQDQNSNQTKIFNSFNILSSPLTKIKLDSDSPATAFANKVLPVPGGP